MNRTTACCSSCSEPSCTSGWTSNLAPSQITAGRPVVSTSSQGGGTHDVSVPNPSWPLWFLYSISWVVASSPTHCIIISHKAQWQSGGSRDIWRKGASLGYGPAGALLMRLPETAETESVVSQSDWPWKISGRCSEISLMTSGIEFSCISLTVGIILQHQCYI